MSSLTIVAVLVSLLSMALALYLSYLVLTHIHATEHMWFIYVFNIPIAFINITISALLMKESLKADMRKKGYEI